MREITHHIVNSANEKTSIVVLDTPGAGGACHKYQVSGPNFVTDISFQNGPIQERGVNGLTQEILLAICIDRLEYFQKGDFSCRENALALTKIQEAQLWLQKRTRDRQERGVEGTNTV
jgi:hypothetical protein